MVGDLLMRLTGRGGSINRKNSCNNECSFHKTGIYVGRDSKKKYSLFDLFLMAHCQGSFALELLKEEITH